MDVLVPAWFFLGALGLLGLAFGSFANVVIWRFPRGESLSSPPSRCPRCETPIRWHDNVPVLGWLILRGKCRDCSEPISVRYPLVEALCGALWVLAGLVWGQTPQTLFAIVFFYLLMILAFIDLDTMRLPNPLVGIMFGVGVVGVTLSQVLRIPNLPLTPLPSGLLGTPMAAAIAGSLAAGGVSLGIAAAYSGVRKTQAFGMGDVKLLAAMGPFLGLYAVAVLFVGSVFGAVAGLVVASRSDKGMAAKFPFGPFLAIAAILVGTIGPQAWAWYLAFAGGQ